MIEIQSWFNFKLISELLPVFSNVLMSIYQKKFKSIYSCNFCLLTVLSIAFTRCPFLLAIVRCPVTAELLRTALRALVLALQGEGGSW